MNATANISPNTTNPPVVREYNIGDKNYIVKSIFIGDTDVKTALLKLAERKAIRDMGLDSTVTLK